MTPLFPDTQKILENPLNKLPLLPSFASVAWGTMMPVFGGMEGRSRLVKMPLLILKY